MSVRSVPIVSLRGTIAEGGVIRREVNPGSAKSPGSAAVQALLADALLASQLREQAAGANRATRRRAARRGR